MHIFIHNGVKGLIAKIYLTISFQQRENQKRNTKKKTKQTKLKALDFDELF